MDFQTIINNCYHDKQLSIAATDLAPGATADMLSTYLPDQRLVLTGITQKTDQDQGVTFVGLGASLPFIGMTITLRFSWTAEQVDFWLTATAPDDWCMADSFPALSDGLLAHLQFATPTVLTMASVADPEASLASGLAFAGTLQTNVGGLERYGFLAPDVSGVQLAGPIAYENGAPQLLLTAPLATGLELGFLNVQEIDLVLHTKSTFNERAQAFLSTTYLEFRTSLAFTTQGNAHQIPLSATLYHPESDIQFDADITALVDAAVEELAFLLNSFSPKRLIPTDFQLEDVIRLSDLNLQINPTGAPKLQAARLQIETTRSWALVKDAVGKPILALDGVQLFFGIAAPFTTDDLFLVLSGEVAVGSTGIIGLTASYPGFGLRGALKAGTTIQLRDLFTQLLGYTTNAVPNLSVDDLMLSIQPGTSFSLAVDLEGNWQIPVAGQTLAIEELKLGVDYKKEQGTTASFEGIIGFDGHDIMLKANHPSANEGWLFEGSTAPEQQLDMQNLVADLEYSFGTAFPYFISNLRLQNLAVTYATKTNDLALGCEAIFPLDNVAPEKWPDLKLGIKLNHVNDRYIKHLEGQLNLMGLQFDLVIDTGGDADIFWGDYQNVGGKPFNVGDIIQLISSDAALYDATKNLSFNIKDAFAGYYKKVPAVDQTPETAPMAKWLLGLDMDFGADLTSLPLVGKYIPKDEALRLTFQPRIATDAFNADEVTALRTIMSGQPISLPDKLDKGLLLNIELNIGGTAVPMKLPVVLDQQSGQLTDQSTPKPTTPSTPPAPAEKATWFNLQKSFGPLQLQRVGVQYENGELTFLLDGGFSVAGLTLSLNGLSASTKLSPLHMSFDLQGLGIDFKGGGVEIGGAFLKKTQKDDQGNDYTEYDGMAIIRAEGFSLSAIGSYAEYEGHPSMFIYAVLDAPLGGPAFFFVTGLAAGFGYNRALKVPSIDQVQQFPLVAQAAGGVPQEAPNLSTQMDLLHQYIPPAVGEYFLAVGIRFTSFKLINSFALLMVSFGKSLEIDLLGLSTLVLPAAEEGNTLTPLAEVQMAMKASYLPEVGFLSVEAKLTTASYLFSRDCHLTGGFAFYTWFAGEHKDEFVLTIGGYHPSYQRPAHFPVVDKLGFNWVINSNLSIKGDAYFALVPSAVMAGAHLNALWQDGNLSAWFNVGADFIIAWKPYHYDARAYADIGVSYTYHFFGTHHITADVGADLHLWGPEFAGTAHVHLWIVTFDINFGNRNAASPQPISWTEFTSSFLPEAEKVCGLSVVSGLEKKEGQGTTAHFVVNPKELLLSFNSLIPLKGAQRGDTSLDLGGANTTWGVGPVGLTADAVDSKAIITIKNKAGEDVTEYFEFAAAQKSVPVALWGQAVSPSLNGKRLIDNAACGLDIKAVPPKAPQDTSFIDRDKFQFILDDSQKASWQWTQMPAFNATPAEQQLNSTEQELARRTYLRDHLETVQDQRTQLLQKLGLATPVFPDKSMADAFLVAPQFAEAIS